MVTASGRDLPLFPRSPACHLRFDVGQILDYRYAWTGSHRKPSFSLNSIFLSRGDGGGGDSDDGRSELFIAGFRVSVRRGATLVLWAHLVLVWREGGPGVRLWDQFPNSTWLVVAVILELYLDDSYFSGGPQILPSGDN
jgi:hypothetical protein